MPLPSVAGAASQPPLSRDGTERAVIPDFVREEAEVFVDWDIQFRPITGLLRLVLILRLLYGVCILFQGLRVCPTHFLCLIL